MHCILPSTTLPRPPKHPPAFFPQCLSCQITPKILTKIPIPISHLVSHPKVKEIDTCLDIIGGLNEAVEAGNRDFTWRREHSPVPSHVLHYSCCRPSDVHISEIRWKIQALISAYKHLQSLQATQSIHKLQALTASYQLIIWGMNYNF